MQSQGLHGLPMMIDQGDDHCTALIERQQNADINKDICKISPFLTMVSTVAVQREDGSP